MISREDRLRVIDQFKSWARENNLGQTPIKLLVYLDLKGYLNADALIEDSKRMELLEQQEGE